MNPSRRPPSPPSVGRKAEASRGRPGVGEGQRVYRVGGTDGRQVAANANSRSASPGSREGQGRSGMRWTTRQGGMHDGAASAATSEAVSSASRILPPPHGAALDAGGQGQEGATAVRAAEAVGQGREGATAVRAAEAKAGRFRGMQTGFYALAGPQVCEGGGVRVRV